MPGPVQLTPELNARFEQLRSRPRYEDEDESVDVLADEIPMEIVAFRMLIRSIGWRRRPRRGPKSPRALRILAIGRPRRACLRKPAEPANVADLVERQLSAIDRILAELPAAHASEPERSARTIASVSRTLKELLRMRAQTAPSASNDDNTMPTDIDEFRRDLARRIEAFVASEADRAMADTGDGSDA